MRVPRVSLIKMAPGQIAARRPFRRRRSAQSLLRLDALRDRDFWFMCRACCMPTGAARASYVYTHTHTPCTTYFSYTLRTRERARLMERNQRTLLCPGKSRVVVFRISMLYIADYRVSIVCWWCFTAESCWRTKAICAPTARFNVSHYFNVYHKHGFVL